MSQGHQQVPCSRRPGTRTVEGVESPPSVSKLLTTDEVAEIIRLSPETLEQWRWLRKEIPFIRLGPKCVRYRQCDLDAWIEKRLVPVSCRSASSTT
jgi:excisionase family DNA binding protein